MKQNTISESECLDYEPKILNPIVYLKNIFSKNSFEFSITEEGNNVRTPFGSSEPTGTMSLQRTFRKGDAVAIVEPPIQL